MGNEWEDDECDEFLRLYDATLERFQPEVLVNYGGSRLSYEIRRRARERGATVVFPLHNFSYADAGPFATADVVFVPSLFAADHYERALSLKCEVLPNLVHLERARVRTRDPQYVTFVNPSYEKGVQVFARIADELGRRCRTFPCSSSKLGARRPLWPTVAWTCVRTEPSS